MRIGIDASRAFQKNRTGIEEYSYQVIKHLRDKLGDASVVLYVRTTNYESVRIYKCTNKLPENWRIKVIKFPYLWTQIGLSLEMLFHPVDVLFIPGHIVPIIYPRNTIVTIHGLEYEFCPKAYSFWARMYMRWAIRRSCRVAKKIIAVSGNTKKDLVKLYKVPEEKIEVIYEGVNPIRNYELNTNLRTEKSVSFRAERSAVEESSDEKLSRSLDFLPRRQAGARDDSKPYLLFIGRIEERKNICGIIDAYKILKEKYQIPHDLILAGAPGYNYKFIKLKINNYLKNSILNNRSIGAKFNKFKIIELGYVDEATKWQLLSNADVFLFPTFYEGFGLPILEAQSVGTPVVAGNNSSIPEIVAMKNPTSPFGRGRSMYSSAGEGSGEQDYPSALLVNSNNPSEIAEAAYKLISDYALRDDIIEKGFENVKRFSWEKCATQINGLFKK